MGNGGRGGSPAFDPRFLLGAVGTPVSGPGSLPGGGEDRDTQSLVPGPFWIPHLPNQDRLLAGDRPLAFFHMTLLLLQFFTQIYFLSSDGQDVQVFQKEGIKNPTKIRANKDGKWIVVIQKDGDEIRIYKIKIVSDFLKQIHKFQISNFKYFYGHSSIFKKRQCM